MHKRKAVKGFYPLSDLKPVMLPRHPPRLQALSVFNQLKLEYHELNQRRKIFYETNSVDVLFQPCDLSYREVEDVSKCLYQLYDTEPKLIFDFVANNSSLTLLPSSEISKITSYFITYLHALETAYLTWRFGNEQKDCIMVMPNKMYFDMTTIDAYFESMDNTSTGFDNVKSDVTSILLHHFDCVMTFVNAHIADLNPAYDEIVFIVGLILYDPDIPDISAETKSQFLEMQSVLVRDFASLYSNSKLNPQIRLDIMLKVVAGIKHTVCDMLKCYT